MPLWHFVLLALFASAPAAGQVIAPLPGTTRGLPTGIIFILPAAEGGSADRVGRIIALTLARILETPVQVKNVPGANGITGTQVIARAPTDGTVIGLALSTPMAGGKLLLRSADYNPLESFDWLAVLGSYGNAMIVRQEHPAKSLAEWLDYARASPKPLRYGTGGAASAAHLAGEYLRVEQRANLVHMAFPVAAQGYAALASGEIDVFFDGVPSAHATANLRQFRIIAVTSAKRDPLLPEVPAFGEVWRNQGFELWAGIVAPNHLQPDARSQFAAAIGVMVNDKALIDEMRRAGLTWLGLAGSDASQFVKDDIVRKARQIGDLAIQPSDAAVRGVP
jgi:tripartite-type tricarboxylate transporter receptor subunit TctC